MHIPVIFQVVLWVIWIAFILVTLDVVNYWFKKMVFYFDDRWYYDITMSNIAMFLFGIGFLLGELSMTYYLIIG